MSKGRISKLTRSYKSLETSPSEFVTQTIENMNKLSHLNAFTQDTSMTQSKLLKLADESAQRYKQNKPLSKIDGVPITFKVNYLVKGMHSNAGSKILNNFKSPIDATLVERI
jgi:Asp-tRNA(Asn)/Glu-tRNA(Gln) amidotransferase A subunit family amidase